MNQNNNLLRIWYQKPAKDWQTEALAVGNGYMGALIFGGVKKDKIHINEKTVWNGGPSERINYKYGNTNPADTKEELDTIKKDLAALRKKLDDKSAHVFGFDGDSYQACGTDTKGEAMDWLNKLMGDLTGYEDPQDYANLYISTNVSDEAKAENYVRDLDLRTALATVSYDYEGVHYVREYFNSYPDNVLAIRLTASEKKSITISIGLEDCTGGTQLSNMVTGDTITMKNALLSNGLKTEAQVKVLPESGNMTSDGTCICVEKADAVTLLLSCGTNYKMELPSFRGEDPHDAVTKRIDEAAEKGYEALKEAHIQDYSGLFSRMELSFDEEIPQIPTDELLQKYRNMVEKNGGILPSEKEQRAMEVICYQFGRYLTIAGSREGALPTNLQGVWGEEHFEWGGDYHFNINVQMNYWPTMASNLGECLLPYQDYLDVLREAGRTAAASAFGIKSEEGQENGWLVGCFSTPYMFVTMGQKNNAAGWNPIGSAWALLNSYEYYLYTEDREFLERLYPSMKEVANFWNEALYWSDYQKRYVSAPSYSPENGPIANGASYDQQFIWQHFENTIQAAQILGVDEELVLKWREKQEKLNPVLVGSDGQVKEWFEETHIGKAQAGELPEINIPQWRQSLGAETGGQQPPHRHLSHLMALYPCNIISKDAPEFMDAAIVSLNERGLDATGWSKAHKLNLWARTGHAGEAFQIIQSAVGGGNSGFLTNLFSSHGGGANYKEYPIFQIDGNFGYTAGINEMLLQSQLGYVQFLPALPEQWKTGYVKGIVARGNFVLDMKWTDGTAESFAVTSRNGGLFTAEYKNLSAYHVTDAKGNQVSAEKQGNDRIAFSTQAGETYFINK
ncbi:MAG: glycoside hydrolase N-terminal domain-containing protein [Eubacteriales bacterium]|nr:glycoside hydrolase N-terminal domain-containing protein [Eubacteriales bacterium]